MSQTKKKIYKSTLLFVAIFVINMLILYTEGIYSADEAIGFGLPHLMINGFKPYKDFNMLLMPFWYYVSALFSQNILVFRIFSGIINAIIGTILIYNTKNILNKVFVGIAVIISLVPFAFSNYNTAMVFFIAMSFVFIMKERTNKSLFFTGLFLSLAFITKQSMPVIIIVLITPLLLIQGIKSKNIKGFLFYAAGGIIPVFVTIVVSLIENYFFEMIDYVFGSLMEFSDNVLEANPCYYFMVFLIVVCIILELLSKDKRELMYIKIGYIISIISFIGIRDLDHVLCVFPFLILVFSYIDIRKIKLRNISMGIVAICILTMSFASVTMYNTIISHDFVETDINSMWKGYKVESVLYKSITEIDDYMNEHSDENIVYLSRASSFLLVLRNISYGPLTIPVRGNCGLNAEEKIKNELEKYDAIIMNDYYSYWAKYDWLVEYIDKNYTNIELNELDIPFVVYRKDVGS